MIFLFDEMTLERLHIVTESLSVNIQVVQYCAEFLKITCLASVICVPFLEDIWFFRSSISEIIPILYIAIARGSPCVVLSIDVKTVL